MTKSVNWRRGAALIAAVAGVALLASCSSQGLGGNADCDYLVMPGITDGAAYQPNTLANCDTTVTIPMTVHVDFIGTGTGPGEVDAPDPTVRSSFVLNRYQVTWENRTTGGSRPGIDVPNPTEEFVASQAQLPPFDFSLTGGPVLSAAAKSLAPLNRADFYPPGGVDLLATITWWGHPFVNSDNWCFGTMQVNVHIDLQPGSPC